MNATISIDRRVLLVVFVVLFVAAPLAIPQSRAVLGDLRERLLNPRITADPSTLVEQRQLAEAAIQDAYLKAVDQLVRTRELRLPIPAAQADAILERYTGQLRQLRREALAAIAETLGVRGAERDRYVLDTEARLDAGGVTAGRNVLIAPALGAIMSQMSAAARQLADAGTREMAGTTSPSPSPR